MNVSSGVSKVNIIYILGKNISCFFWGASFLEMFWDIQYSNFRIFKDFFLLFHANFFIKIKVCLPIDRLNIEDVFVK